MRIIVAALGHAWLKDQSFGMKVLDRIRDGGVPRGVELADLSYGTITAFQRLRARRYDAGIFVSGTVREREPGTLHELAPPAALPPVAEIHDRIADAVMGLVSVDTLVILARHFGVLEGDILLVEAEPVDETWGRELSPELAALVAPAARRVRDAITALSSPRVGEVS